VGWSGRVADSGSASGFQDNGPGSRMIASRSRCSLNIPTMKVIFLQWTDHGEVH
jgi:hypothetical protein